MSVIEAIYLSEPSSSTRGRA